MIDPASLLATLAQSSAAIVAIVGGFLVSRLASAEGLKRQLKAAEEERARLQQEWEPARQYRLENSVQTLKRWLAGDLIDEWQRTKDLSIEEILGDRIPRGSSSAEMLPYAERFRGRVHQAFADVLAKVQDGDIRRLDLDDLKQRGLTFSSDDEDLYESLLLPSEVARCVRPYALRRNDARCHI